MTREEIETIFIRVTTIENSNYIVSSIDPSDHRTLLEKSFIINRIGEIPTDYFDLPYQIICSKSIFNGEVTTINLNYLLNGKRHNKEHASIIFYFKKTDRIKEYYYLNDIFYSKENWLLEVNRLNMLNEL